MQCSWNGSSQGDRDLSLRSRMKRRLKTLKDTEEILICFNFTWKITQCLLPGLAQRCGFLRERVVKMLSVGEHEAPCQNIPCVCDRCGVSPSASSVCRGAVDSSCVTVWGWHQALLWPVHVSQCGGDTRLCCLPTAQNWLWNSWLWNSSSACV